MMARAMTEDTLPFTLRKKRVTQEICFSVDPDDFIELISNRNNSTERI